MRVSVIVPAYNVEAHIFQTLSSLAAQSLADFEAIIIDDGSTDATLERIRAFCAQDPRFRCESQANAGVSAARNRGLDLACGEFVAFLDGDDEYPPTALEKLVARADEFEADQVIGNYQVFDDVHAWHIPAMDKMLLAPAYAPLDEGLLACYVIWNRLYRRSLIEAIGLRFPPLAFAEDSVFAMSYTYRCNRIATVRDDVYRYRRRSRSVERSATQVISLASERDHAAAHAAVREAAEERFAEEASFFGSAVRGGLAMKLASYRDALLLKEAGNLMEARYAHFWTIEDGVAELIGRRIDRIRHEASLTAWDELVRETCEASVENLPVTAEAVVATAVVSVSVWSDGSNLEEYRATLDSLLGQRMANVLIYAPEELLAELEIPRTDRENLIALPHSDEHTFCNAVLDACTTDYLLVAQSGIIYRPSALRRMHGQLCHANYDFVSTTIARITPRGSSFSLRPQAIAFRTPSADRGKRADATLALDFLFANKLLRVSSLHDRGFRFTGANFEDVSGLYRSAYFLHTAEQLCGSNLSDDEFARRFLSHADGRVESYRRRLYHAITTWVADATLPVSKLLHTGSDRRTRVVFGEWWMGVVAAVQRVLPVRDKVFFYSIRANGRLTDNAKLVYEALADVPRAHSAHLVPHSPLIKLRVYYHLLTSRVIVTDDYLRYLRMVELRPEQRVVQLWHATGAFKTFGLDGGPHPPYREILNHRQYDAIVVSSEWTGERYAHAFGIPADRALALGTPRTDALFDASAIEQTRERVFSRFPLLRESRVLLYAPTFRDDDSKRSYFDSRIDFKDLSASLPDGTVLVICRHPVITNRILGNATYDNILEPKGLSTNDAMLVADVLITDYSTVIFDFALLGRPVVLYCPDLDEYDRGFYFDFPEQIGAPIAHDHAELRALLTSPTTTLPEMDADFVRKQVGACDGHSTTRVADLIRAYLGDRR